MADKYSAEQKDAAAFAYEDRGVRPARRVVELAAAGELEHNGEKLPPFQITQDMVRWSASQLRKKRAGLAKSVLTEVPTRDAVEAFRRRAVSYVDHEMAALERRQKHGRTGPKDHDVMDRLIRMAGRIAALPDRDDPRPNPVPPKHAGGVDIDKTLGGSILAANQKQGPRRGASQDTAKAENGGAAQHAAAGPTEAQADDWPGAWMREQMGRLQG